MANTKNLISFAKKGGKGDKEENVKSSETPLTPEEERDLKAKQKVNELLSDVDLNPKKEELIEMESEPQPKDVEWLSEQVTALTAENDVLKSELEIAKNDYAKLQSARPATISSASNDAAFVLFKELQDNYLKYPSQARNQTTVNVRYMLNRLCQLFPEFNKIKKF